MDRAFFFITMGNWNRFVCKPKVKKKKKKNKKKEKIYTQINIIDK